MSFISPVYSNLTYRSMDRGSKQYNKHVERPLPRPVEGHIWLRVPYAEKNKAKAQGAMWDPKTKFWWAKHDDKLRRFLSWIPKEMK